MYLYVVVKCNFFKIKMGKKLKKIKNDLKFFIKMNEPRTHYILNRMATPWNNLPKDIALAHSVNSFKSTLDLYLNKVGSNTHIYS